MDQGKQDGNPTLQPPEKELYGHQEENHGHQKARKRMLSPSVDENDTMLPMPEADPTTDPDVSKAKLLPNSTPEIVNTRKKIVNKITETLKTHSAFNGEEGLQKLRKRAARYEEKIFKSAISLEDYLSKASLKMSGIKVKATNRWSNSIQSTETNNATNSNPDYLGGAFVFGNIILEALSAALDQESSPKRPQYALIGLIMSVIAVAVCIVDFFLKARKEEVYLSRWGYIWWFFTKEGDTPFGSFPDVFGSVCAIFQCVFASIQYAYCIRHAENPIKISLVPLVFAICVACSRFLPQNREPLRHGHIP